MAWKDVRRNAYMEKLKDPRWQQMRLRVFERDGWACVFCGGKERTLNVHHWYYARGREPWECDLGALATLCDDCHGEETDRWPQAQAKLIEALKIKRFDSFQVDDLAQTVIDQMDGRDEKVMFNAFTYCYYHAELRGQILALYEAHFAGRPGNC